MADEIIVRVRAEGVQEFTKQLKAAGIQVETTSKKVEETNKKVESSFGKLSKTIGAAFSVGVLIQFTKRLGKLATELDSTEAKFKTVFGNAAKIVEDFAKKNANSLGLTQSEYKKAAAAIGDLLIPLGFQRRAAAEMSAGLVDLSGKLAAWDTQQRSSSEISNILSKAILGEREQLKSLGIQISEADVKGRLLEKGQAKATGTVLAQAKAQATLELILEKSTDAQNSFSDSTETLKEKQLKTAAAFRELGEVLATKVIPIYSKLLDVINSIAEKSPTKQIIKELEETDILTKAQLDTARELIIARQAELDATKKTTNTLGEQNELANQIPAALRKINKLEEERTGLVGVRRGGATDEQRADVKAQNAADEIIKKEEERIRLEKEKEESLKRQLDAQKKLKEIISKGVEEIKNELFVSDLFGDLPEELSIALNEAIRITSAEKKILEIDAIISDEAQKSITDAFALLEVAVRDADAENERVWQNEIDRQKELAKIKEENLNKSLQGIGAISQIQQTAFAAFSQGINNELIALENKNKNGLISDKEYAKERAALLTKQAKADKAQAIFQATINTAAAVVKALPNFILAAIVGALGIAQIAKIAQQPIPKFAKGTKGDKKAPAGLKMVHKDEIILDEGGYNIITATDSKEIMKILAGYGVPTQMRNTHDEMNKPMKTLSAITNNNAFAQIDWNPLLNSSDMQRRSLGKKLDKVNWNLERMNQGLTHRMTRN